MVFENVDSILFDFGGTLEYPGMHLNERLEEYLKPYLPLVDRDLIDEKALGVVRNLYSVQESRTMSYPQILKTFTESTLDLMGLGDQAWVKDIVDRFVRESQEEVDRNVPVLRRIHEKYRMAVLSNNYGNTEGILRDYGMLEFFEAVFDSTVVGLRKPHEEFFLHGLTKLGWEPKNTAYVGDRYERDVEGPKALGMKTIWVTGDLDRACPNPSLVDARIHRLEELLTVLPRLEVSSLRGEESGDCHSERSRRASATEA